MLVMLFRNSPFCPTASLKGGVLLKCESSPLADRDHIRNLAIPIPGSTEI